MSGDAAALRDEIRRLRAALEEASTLERASGRPQLESQHAEEVATLKQLLAEARLPSLHPPAALEAAGAMQVWAAVAYVEQWKVALGPLTAQRNAGLHGRVPRSLRVMRSRPIEAARHIVAL